MLKLTIEASSISELKTKLVAAASELGGTATNTTEAPKADAKKPAAAAKPAAAPKAPALDFKTQVAAPFLALADKNRDKAIEVLGTFGVGKASELKPEQYVEFVAAIAAADAALEELV